MLKTSRKWFLLLLIIPCLLLTLHFRSIIINRNDYSEDLFYKASYIIQDHYASLVEINNLTSDIIEQDEMKEDLLTMVILLRDLDVANHTYSGSMLVWKERPITRVNSLLNNYGSIISSYTFGNLVENGGVAAIDYDLFISAVTDLQIYSKWVVDNYAFKEPVIIYTEEEFTESSMYEELKLTAP